MIQIPFGQRIIKTKQGALWCTACKGKGCVTYKNWKQQLSTVKCPKCRGTGLGQ